MVNGVSGWDRTSILTENQIKEGFELYEDEDVFTLTRHSKVIDHFSQRTPTHIIWKAADRVLSSSKQDVCNVCMYRRDDTDCDPPMGECLMERE